MKSNFDSFRLCFKQKEYSLCLSFLDECFSENPLSSFKLLYESGFLFSESFNGLDFNLTNIPREYVLLFAITTIRQAAVNKASVFVNDFSKEQLLQGAANFLEKRNTELKYNSHWMQKYLNGQENYLETERQATYNTSAGIQFQYILQKIYNNAPEQSAKGIQWNLDLEEQFAVLFYEISQFNAVEDIIERHLYFNWSLEYVEENTIKTNPPSEQKEGTFANDISNLSKGKTAFTDIEKEAEEALIKECMQAIENPQPHPDSYWKYMPDNQNETQMKEFAQAMYVASIADYKVMQEMILFKKHYLPGIEELNGLILKDGSKLPLKETFNVLSFLSALSREYISKIDKQYIEGVNYFSHKAHRPEEGFMIDFTALRNKGDSETIKQTIRESYSEKLHEEQQYIIWQSKNKIDKELCLIKQNYDELIKTIQWIYQYEADFIRKVIELFVFDSTVETGVTRLPFFKIGESILWLPNMIAWTFWGENLIENLISKKMITIHQVQTQLFETSLKSVFKFFKFDIIENDSDKEFKNSDKKRIGDFDLLAHKNGHILHLQLKLTNTRNSFHQRFHWKKQALTKATAQLATGNEFIRNNPEQIRKILGLSINQEIKSIHSFIVSNVFQFDHEKIGDNLKVSFYELIQILSDNEKGLYSEEDYLRYKILDIIEANQEIKTPVGFREWAERKQTLDMQEHLPMLRNFVEYHRDKFWPDGTRDVERLAQLLHENRLWKQIERIPVDDSLSTVKSGHYSVILPGVHLANIGIV